MINGHGNVVVGRGVGMAAALRSSLVWMGWGLTVQVIV
jgi:hypothetical protein